MLDPIISEEIILKKLNNLNVTKSPGPDNIHPRILYELRHEIATPLEILFETSYNLGQLLLLLSSDTAYQAQGCSVVLHVVESTDETIM